MPTKRKPEEVKKFPKKNPRMARDQSLMDRKKNSAGKKKSK